MIDGTKIELSGNPFVDTGLGVIASLAKLDDIDDLTLSHLYKVHGNGDQLTRWNSRLKSFTQIFGTNNPLYQYSYGFKKGRGPSEINRAVYKNTLEGLLSAIDKVGTGERCWACGSPSSFDFAQICKKAVEASNKKAPDHKVVGRDWFPLAGSLGSDAQSLPAASRPPHICPRCLLAVHYLPIGSMLLNGMLTVFQSTSQEFWFDLVRSIVEKNEGRVQLGDYETLGAKGSRVFIETLLALFDHLQKDAHGNDAPEALYVWRFTNSGASPDCTIEEIPNFALLFLSKATKEGLRSEITSLLMSEGKKPQYSLYQCILDRRDYPNLYPEGKRGGASPKLYALYQTYIRNHSAKALHTAHKLARTVSGKISEKELKRIQRREAFRETSVRNQFRAIMVRMTEEGQFTLDEYLDLFPLKEGRGITVEWDGWNIVRFYLHHAGEDFATMETDHQERKELRQHLPYCAGQIYDYHLNKRGGDWFQTKVLAQFDREINTHWLMDQFTQLGETEDGFTYENWLELCKLDDEKLFVSELLFQMRLLWSQWIYEGKKPAVLKTTEDKSADRLPEQVKILIGSVFADYVGRRGLERFHRDILLRLRRKEIGEFWFREKLTKRITEETQPLTEEEWEGFLIGDEGQNLRKERLFQLHLALVNLYKKRRFNQEREEATND
jgi:CRISPR-associated protein Cst1